MNNNKKLLNKKIKVLCKDLQEHFKTSGWKLDLDFYSNQIIVDLLGIDAIEYIHLNLNRLSSDMEVPLVIDRIDGLWYIVPKNSMKVFYNETDNLIILRPIVDIHPHHRILHDIVESLENKPQDIFLGLL